MSTCLRRLTRRSGPFSRFSTFSFVLALGGWAFPAYAAVITVDGNLRDGGDCTSFPLNGTWDDAADTCFVTVDLTLSPADKLIIRNAILDIAAGVTIGNFGDITIHPSGTITTSGTIDNLDPEGQLDNKGTINIENNGLIRNFPTTSVMINTGSININSPTAELLHNGSTFNTSGTLNVNGKLTVASRSAFMTNDGTIENNSGAMFKIQFGTFTTSGTINNSGDFRPQYGTPATTNNGIIRNTNSGIIRFSRIINNGMIFNCDLATYENLSLFNTGTFNNAAFLNNDGIINNPGTLVNCGTLMGNPISDNSPVNDMNTDFDWCLRHPRLCRHRLRLLADPWRGDRLVVY